MKELSYLLLRLYALARETPLEGFRDAAFRLVKPALSFDSSTWASGRMAPEGFDFHSVHLHQEAPDRLELYEEVKSSDKIAQTAVRLAGTAVNVHMPAWYPGRANAGMREYAAAVGHQNGLLWSGRHAMTDLVHWVGLYRRKAQRAFSEDERRLYEFLAPHLIEAQAVNRAIHAREAAAGAARRHWRVGIADRRGVLHHADPDLGEVLRLEWPACEEWMLPRTLVDALACDPHRYAGRSIVVTALEVEDLLFVKARAQVAADALTARERLVARHVASGRTYKEIARALAIAPATARNHMQAIYRRLDVHSKAELAARLLLLDE